MSLLPTVSVLMPAFNAEEHIAEAMASVIAQSFPDFELVVLNDGSTDRTVEIAQSFVDHRVRHVDIAPNRGLAAARNAALEHARGRYIAWLDADDVSLPHRLARQVALLDQHSRIGICGTWVRTIGTSRPAIWRYPRDPEYLRARLLFDDPLATSSVMMRREIAEGRSGAFDADFAPAEDYDLWERCAVNDWRITNIPRVLTHYRVHENQTSVRASRLQREAVIGIQGRQLERLGILPTHDEWKLHLALGVEWGHGLNADDGGAASIWLDKIEEANRKSPIATPAALAAVVRQRRRLARQRLGPTAFRRGVIGWHSLTH